MDPLNDDVVPALELVHRYALDHLKGLKDRRAATLVDSAGSMDLPDVGNGAVRALQEILDRYGDGFSGSPGPRYWGFVNGGVTPAALAADWLCSTVDQNTQLNGDGPGAFIEFEAISMLRELFGLSTDFYGVFVTGGTMANNVGLGVALQSLGARRGVDVSYAGVAALAPVRIITGESHSSIAKSAAMLGLGRDCIIEVPRLLDREAVDPIAMAKILEQQTPDTNIIIVANAGTVLTGDFDDLNALADLAQRHNAHLHIDGAFGAFAACTQTHRHLVRGLERGDTIASDGHKFLNVPFDSGFVFAKALGEQMALFKNVSTYQTPPRPDPRHYLHLTPQNSRRMRALAAWVTLRAYGMSGYRAIIERCCRLAAELARRLDTLGSFKVLVDVRYNVVCFQLLGADGNGLSEEQTTDFLTRIRDDGRVFVTPGNLRGTACVRLAIVNWRTTDEDIDIAVQAFQDCHPLNRS